MKSPEEKNAGYNARGYFRQNNRLGQNRYPSRPAQGRDDESEQHDNYAQSGYDDLNTGKYENYNADGYYGSNYGSVNDINTGRDYEQNAGYRDSYNRLTTGQWPEIEDAERRRGINANPVQGLHRGKGPRSYQRSDFRIQEDVNDALTEDRYVDAGEIEVTVQNGEVVLTGTVEDRNAKRRVEDVLENISGIKHLENRLKVRNNHGQYVNIRTHRR